MEQKTFTSDFKAQFAIAARKGQQTTNEIAQEFRVKPSQVNIWKTQLLENSGEVSAKANRRAKPILNLSGSHSTGRLAGRSGLAK